MSVTLSMVEVLIQMLENNPNKRNLTPHTLAESLMA